MAIDLNDVRFLIMAQKGGVVFENVIMFGRQELDIFPEKLKALFESQGLSTAALTAALERASKPYFAEPVFEGLGAKEVASLDASSYQNATFVHDMNLPLPDSLKNRFSVVYDSGSLEHVFNVPVALKNCMQMVKPGGRLFLHTPANNWFGHGFFQFSPELFFRALSEENGFEIEMMIAHPVGPYGRWYKVNDPKTVRGRVELISFYPVLLLIQARKIREVEIFAHAPQQSDYEVMWDETPKSGDKKKQSSGLVEGLKRSVPGVAHFFRAMRTGIQFYRRHSFGNRKCFTPIEKE